MITASQIIAGSMLLISVVILLLVLFTDKIANPVKYKKFFTATTIIYITGTILVMVIVSVNKEIPIAFSIISEIMILAIYLFSMFMIKKLANSVVELEKAQKEAQNKTDAE